MSQTDRSANESSMRPSWIDPELAAINVLIPRLDLTDIPGARILERRLSPVTPPDKMVQTSDRRINGSDGQQVAVRIYYPSNAGSGRLPLLVYFHGGSFMLGGLHTEDQRCHHYAANVGCAVLSVDYRLAPEHPFPAAFDDCLDAVRWAWLNSDELNIDTRRVAVGGNSSGGALAASIALECRHAPMPRITHQVLINPVLDHQTQSYSSRYFAHTPVLTRDDIELMWRSYRGDLSQPVDYRMSPAAAEDLSGVAAASIWIAEHDPLRDEAFEYATRLMRAGVSLGVHMHRGTFHGFDSFRTTDVGKRALAEQVLALRKALQP